MTGVQTCALPICSAMVCNQAETRIPRPGGKAARQAHTAAHTNAAKGLAKGAPDNGQMAIGASAAAKRLHLAKASEPERHL